MKFSAILFMGITWAAVIALNVFCFSKILSKGNRKADSSESGPEAKA